MKRLVFEITHDTTGNASKEVVEVISDRDSEWTISQYLRHRMNTQMELISETETNQTEYSWTKIS
jgi:hypothetical protein